MIDHVFIRESVVACERMRATNGETLPPRNKKTSGGQQRHISQETWFASSAKLAGCQTSNLRNAVTELSHFKLSLGRLQDDKVVPCLKGMASSVQQTRHRASVIGQQIL